MARKPKMTICRNCNAPIAKNAKICPSCGAKNKKPFYRKWWFILLIIIIAIGAVNSISKNKKEKFNWKEVELCNRMPEPESHVGTVLRNDSDGLSMHVEKTSEEEYKAYIEECQTMGYTVESEKEGDLYHAFDEEGYELSLSYIGETMYIELDAPEELGTLNWPKSEIAGLLPLPQSTVGKVSNDSADGCFIYVGETSIDDFNAYADECAANGFSVDYERGDKFYNAKDENGNRLFLAYQGNHMMSVQIEKTDEPGEGETEFEPESETSAEEPETETAETEMPGDGAESADGIRPEFQKAMGSYEEFMDEYCDFMKKYGESDGTDVGLLADYSDYMSKYADAVKDFEAWEDTEMNAAETAYYLEVQTRINEKLLEVIE